ncbi:MAG: nitroreductase family protein [Eubacteriales bacterium]|nr:nitroreductase family protein [Eubacteriales bacterium]
MIKIDYNKCIGCMKCVSVCPFQVLDSKDGKPAMQDERRCIKCLHCAAACPQKAIDLGELEGVLPGELPAVPEDLPKLIEGFLMTRRSYRLFKPEPVPRDTLRSALKVSAWAPSAKNQHPTKWIVIDDENKIRIIMDHILDFVKETGVSPEIAELYNRGQNVVMGNAKTLILAYARTDAINPPVDTALALHQAELLLQAQGIGTCWAGYLMRMCNQVPALKEIFKLPEGCQFYAAMMAGYPDNEQYLHIPNRHKQTDIQWL